ncbi:DNA methyltransferase [Selenomonas sp. oral taxon 126]|uniref:DNA methyltransferase n=1 Tax=Selenomonas sp. oral taxon 126 TaxID=712528 RepID=UPI0009FD0D19|nr:DNA methyltransferase [Selenomonas sp. oral taxon 126]
MVERKSSLTLTNPKLRDNIYGKADWYPYYAGYAQGFVSDVLDLLKIEPGQTILDPWNGSGTTTQVAMHKGIQAYGYDINPVMVTVANAKALSNITYDALIDLANHILEESSPSKMRIKTVGDPLNYWFQDDSIYYIRKLDFYLVKHTTRPPYSVNGSTLRDFFHVILFRTVKSLLPSFRSTNPTWIKKATSPEERIHITRKKFYKIFLQETMLMAAYFKNQDQFQQVAPIIAFGDSRKLNLATASVDHVITSPPYCTRIDYVIATLPELALLKLDHIDFNDLRSKMLGTNKIQKTKDVGYSPAWGGVCKDFLKSVAAHGSKASKEYYLKVFLQYFHSFYNSMIELHRVLKQNGTCTLVVQSSYYKDVYLDLPSIIEEMSRLFYWKLEERRDFNSKATLSNLNKGSRSYREPSAVQETVLFFKKKG